MTAAMIKSGAGVVPFVKFTDEVWANDVDDINVDEFLTGEMLNPSVRMATTEEILELYRPSEDSWSSQ